VDPMKVCYWGTFEKRYPRNAVLISGLRQNGIDVIECHFPLWKEGFQYNKMTLLSGFAAKLRFLGRALVAYPTLLCRYLSADEHDAVVVGYWGHIDILILAPFARLKQKPIIFDAFFSLYDTAISDWGLAPENSRLARLCHFLDRSACRLATLVLVDTGAQKEFFCGQFGLPQEKVRWLYVGADDSLFAPSAEPSGPRPFRALYIGNYVPLHGVPVILRAAQLLNGEEVEFWLIGENHREDPALKDLLRNSNPQRVRFYPWMPPEELRTKIAEADVCLGIFGTSGKARRVIPGKAFLALAMGKPLITGDSPAARELLEDGKTALLCGMGDPHALADAILRLKRDSSLQLRIGKEGWKLFHNECSPKVLGSLFASLLGEVLVKNEPKMFEIF